VNIVYLLTNLSKEEGRRFYIGSKVECQIANIDGVATIMQRTGKPYYGSSSCPQMKQDMQSGHVFEASVLEVVVDRKQLIERERSHISERNAVLSDEYYNLAEHRLDPHKNWQVGNCYGEEISKIAKDRSAMSKRDANARRAGFNNFGDQMFVVWDRNDAGENMAAIAESLGFERHRFLNHAKKFNKEKSRYDVLRIDQQQTIRSMFAKGATLGYIAEHLDMELPAVRSLLGNFDAKYERAYLTAKGLGMTKEELEVHVTKRILDGERMNAVAISLGIDTNSVKMYFFRCIRSRLKGSDL
jgi:hypothetical protein